MDRGRFRLATLGIAVTGGIVVWIVSTALFPYHSLNHDEGVYLQQMAMLLEGQLHLDPPVPAVFRPWFFVESEGFYPKYSPVPAALFAGGELLGSARVALSVVGAGILASVAGVVSEVFDRRHGILAAVFVLASPLFVLDTAVFLPYAPTALLNLAFAYGYLRADRTGSRRWAALAGASIGLAFFARPYTALLFAVPFILHAAWTLRTDWQRSASRQAVTAAFGLTGVGLALGYNALLTGSPLLFPYEAFAPRDGLGFGRRALLDHAVAYTPGLALEANGRVIATFATRWIVGGIAGTGLALVGLLVAGRRGWRSRHVALAGLFVSIPLGNVFFWGNDNILGNLDRTGDGLIAVLGPYYHFDLLVPTAAFAAVGALAAVDALQNALVGRLDRQRARGLLLALVVASSLFLGAVTVGQAADPLERNQQVTATYETAYEPFEPKPPANAVVLTPTPYGPWLNHPFQYLRNDPGYDGATVYAAADRPFAVADAFPDRRLFRYGYRGVWDPLAGSPDAATLQRVSERRGQVVVVNASVGFPAGVSSATVTVETDDGTTHAVASDPGAELPFALVIDGDHVTLGGPLETVDNGSVAISPTETVRVTIYADYAASGFEYRLSLPIATDGKTVRVLTPRQEYCLDARACGGGATLVQSAVPEGVFVRTELRAMAQAPN